MKEWPTTPKAIKARISSYRCLLRKEIDDHGRLGDGHGKRYLLFCLYFLLKEDADVRIYLDWYTTEFPDDSGEVTQLICWALILRRLGREDEALYRFVQAIDENLPAVALLVGDSQAPYGIWGEEVMGLNDMPDEVAQAMSADEKRWLVTSWHSSAVTAMRQQRIALGKDLVVTSEYDKRSAISKSLGALVEAFRPAEMQRYSMADLGSWLMAGRSSGRDKVIKPPPGFWTKVPQIVPHEIVVTFTDRGPLRIRYFISSDLAKEVVKRMMGKVIVGNGKSIPTNTAISFAVVPDGQGPDGAEEIRTQEG